MATLYLVSTPIGNLDDVSARAVETLKNAHRILAEDTRRTRILTDRVGASAPLVSLHAHNERERTDAIVAWLQEGEDLALVTDAGTPLVSDPGGRVVSAVVAAGHDVVPVPGPSAVLAALVASGLPAERFTFLGFLARKGKDREADLSKIVEAEETVIVFESPHRLVRLLEELDDLCEAGRRVAVARELTKLHEEFVRGTLSDVAAYYQERPPKGEVTVVVGPPDPDTEGVDVEAKAARLAREMLDEGMRPSTVAKEVAARLDLARNDAYRIVHDLKGS